MILVTGGGGYIGSQLVSKLVQRGHRVRVIDTFWFGNHLDGASPNGLLEVWVGDIRDTGLLHEALEGATHVVHLAAISNDPSAELDETWTWEVNWEASVALLRLAREAGVRRFVNASSASVYGVSEAPRVTEDLPHRPFTLYARLKSAVDRYCEESATDTFRTCSVRSATVFGWSPRMRFDLTANLFTAQAVHGRLTVHGGRQSRPYIGINDLCEAYYRLITCTDVELRYPAYNVCSGNATVAAIAATVREAVNPSAELIVDESSIDVRSYRLDAGRIRISLGFGVRQRLEDGVAEVARRIRDGDVNPDDEVHWNIRRMSTVHKRGPDSASVPLRG